MKNLILLGLLLSSLAHAQEVIPGLIPRFYSIEAARDLPLPPDVAHTRALSGLDLSTLDPKDGTNIWNNSHKSIPDLSLVRSGEVVGFVQDLPSRSGQLRFTVRNSANQEFIVILSKKVHNFLLRRNILAKLGYNSQPMSWVPNLKLSFTDTIDRDLFKEKMNDKLLAGTDRWITKEDQLEVSLQDALILTPESDIYNLATGIMPPAIHQGRRLLRAPYVPLALVDTTESVNLMPWLAGRVVLNHVKLNHTQDLDTTYGASWEDARWIGRRLGALTRGDFQEIVEKSYYPLSVEKLLIEKIISRRNDLMNLLALDKETSLLEFNAQITAGSGVKDGEVIQEFFPGYASRFSYGDPESPFSASELNSFSLTKGQSQLIDIAIGQLNKFFGTNDNKNYVEKINSIVAEEGPYFSTKVVTIPTFHGSIILSRDIVTGTYLGTNNKVQLVDNFGFAVDAGVVNGIEGLPFEVPIQVKAGGGMAFQRLYSHVKPVISLKKSLKEPYKNMLVPMLIKSLGNKIDQLTSDPAKKDEALMNSILTDLKGSLSVGESFIVTDSIVPFAYTQAEMSLSQLLGMDKNLLKIFGKVQANRMILTRFHLFRSDENTFQIYQDYGKDLKLMVSLKLRSYIPLISFNARWNTATAETNFYPISIHPRAVTPKTLKALRQSILSLNHSALKGVVTPHRVQHDIGGSANTIQFLMFKRNRIGSDQSMKLTHALGGEQKNIYRRYDATTGGVDYAGYSVEVVNNLVRILTNSDLALSDMVTLNPGFNVGGKAKNKIYTSEHDGSRLTINFNRILNGWRVGPGKMKQMLEQLNREAGREIFNNLSVINTDSILLYQIAYTYTITQEGAQKLLTSSSKQLESIMMSRSSRGRGEVSPEKARILYQQLKKIRSELSEADPGNGMKRLHSWLRSFQDETTVRGLEDLVGSDNIVYQGRIEGFRQGDENGDNPVFSHVYGVLPLPLHVSPTQQVMQNWGILEGELLANWLMERAI
jgi:hypothetical protein